MRTPRKTSLLTPPLARGIFPIGTGSTAAVGIPKTLGNGIPEIHRKTAYPLEWAITRPKVIRKMHDLDRPAFRLAV
jgi:hypothetical protein